MAIGQSNFVAVRYVEETTYGTTPSAALKNLRYTTESLKSVKNTNPSADIIQERRIREIVELSKEGSGDIEFELSYSNLDDLMEGALMNDWSLDDPASGTDTLTDANTLKSYTIEKEYTDLTTPEFETFTGARIGGLSLSVEPENPITASMSILGKSPAVSETTAGTGSATAAPTNAVMVVGAHVSAFLEGGSAFGTSVLGFTLDIENNLRTQRSITSLDPRNIGAGRVNISGTLRAYFEDSAEIDKFQDFTDTSLKLTVADDASNQYLFELFSVKYTDMDLEHQGTEGDAIVALSWQAFRDTTEGTVISIERS